ncbi:MAG TPA: MobF family relaxase [Candidatus Binataceae bacterium]|nr:MobF family relaxase [Candidatus Binataceae bacterium]
MLVMSKGALSAAQAETYYEEKYVHDDYYSERQQVVGEWFGKGANALGLSGEVATEDFRAILNGQRPQDGEVLVHTANGRSERRAGWDATFNAPKSVSIQALVGGDARLAEAHRHAVSCALGELEQYALSRRNGGSEWVVSANIVAARFDHIAARPSQGVDDGYGPDPHLHTHVVIANLTQRPDGAWRGLDPVEIYRSQSFATAIYRSELARQVQRLGYGIEITSSDARWELQGYTREQVMAFSRRRKDIEQELSRRGLSGAGAAQNVAHQSRLAKDGRREAELREEWRTRAHGYRIDLQAPRHAQIVQVSPFEVQDAVGYAVTHATEREAVVDRRALEGAALQHSMGRASLTEIRDEGIQQQLRGELIEIKSAQHASFTTPEMLRLETENLELMRARRGRANEIAPSAQINRWSRQRGLLSDQAQAAEITLSSRDWLTSIEGLAGSAKTTTVGAIAEFAGENGYTVLGFAPTTRAVRSLSEAGIEAQTVASLLETSSPEDTIKRQFWIVDESSLLSTRQVNRLLQRAWYQDVDRIVFVGDQRQHHAIEAGRPIFQMQQAGMAVARLDTIRRQRDGELRQAVKFAATGRVAEALARLKEQNRIREIASTNDRYQAIAREFVGAHESGERVLVVSPANDERRQLNEAIRELLRSRGNIETAGHDQTVLINRNLTATQRTSARNYEEGDVIRYRRGSAKLGLARCDYGQVKSVDAKHHRIKVRTENGKLVEYNPKRPSGVEVFRAEHRTLAVGDRIQFRAPDRALKVANGELATIRSIDDEKAILRTDAGREIRAARQRLRHIDYGYASTSHSSQGATVDRVIVNIDTLRSAELVNRKQFYVSVSRARHAVSVYTDDRQALQYAVNRDREKSLALEHARRTIKPQIKQTPLAPRQTITPSHGFRM